MAPPDRVVKAGESFALRVEAKFSNGSVRDVTSLCAFESLDPRVAIVTDAGTVEGKEIGDTAILVRYQAHPALALVLVPRASAEPFAIVNGLEP